MENVYENADQENADSPNQEAEYENSGRVRDRQAVYENSTEAREPLYSEVQVHTSERERNSPEYMEIREGAKSSSSSSSSSSSDDEQSKEEQPVMTMELPPEPEVLKEKPNSEGRDGSRRSSASSNSSSSSSSHGDPSDDLPIPPKIHDEDNAEDGLLMTYTRPYTKPEDTVDYSLKTLENVTLDESSKAPDDPNQPSISLYVKVRSPECKMTSTVAQFTLNTETLDLPLSLPLVYTFM